jgi:hypothetical protein
VSQRLRAWLPMQGTRHANPSGMSNTELKAQDLMSRNGTTVQRNAQNGKLVGILTEPDFVAFVART